MRRRSAVYLTLVLLALCFPVGGHGATVSLRADFWCPFNCEPDAARPGFMVEIAQYALGKYGHTVDYQIMPWNRAIKEVRAGKIDGVIAELKSHSPDLIYPAREAALAVNAFWVKKGTPWRYQGIDSLNGVTLGIIRDYAFGNPLDAYVLKNKLNISRVAMVNGEQAVAQNIKRLVLGRIDVYVEAQAVVRFQAGKDGQADLLESAGILNATPLYVAFSPQRATSAAYARMLAEGVDELRATGKLDNILYKYGLHDWKRDEAQQ